MHDVSDSIVTHQIGIANGLSKKLYTQMGAQ